MCKISAQYVRACKRKLRKTVFFLYSKFKKRHNSLKILMQSDDTRTCSVVHQNKVMCKISAQYVTACRRKVRKTMYFLYSMFTKRHNSFKNWRKVTTLILDLKYTKTESYAKFQLNMSKHLGEKCGKLCISYILSLQRGITPSKIDQSDDAHTWSAVH